MSKICYYSYTEPLAFINKKITYFRISKPIFAGVIDNCRIKKVKPTLSIFGLVLLLLLLPCKVRNFIQSELGVPQTQVLNKSKSAIYESDCQTFEVATTIQTIPKPTIQQSDFPFSDAYSFEFTINSLTNSYTQIPSNNKKVSGVPLYILYQNIQVYS